MDVVSSVSISTSAAQESPSQDEYVVPGGLVKDDVAPIENPTSNINYDDEAGSNTPATDGADGGDDVSREGLGGSGRDEALARESSGSGG